MLERLALCHQLRQPRDPARYPVSLILRQPPRRKLPLRLILEMDVGQNLPGPVHDCEGLAMLGNRPRRREAAAVGGIPAMRT